MSVTIVFDATALTRYATVGDGGLTVGEIAGEVGDDATATVAVPVLAIAEAYSRLGKHEDDMTRLKRLLDADRSPIAVIPVGPDDGEALGDFYVDLRDLPAAHAALVSLEHQAVPILTGNGDLYRNARLGLDILDL